MNQIMKGRLHPLMDGNGKYPLDFPGNADGFWMLSGTIDVFPHFDHFLVVDTSCLRFAEEAIWALIVGYGLPMETSSGEARNFLVAFLGVPVMPDITQGPAYSCQLCNSQPRYFA
jgi:hypothetical protein